MKYAIMSDVHSNPRALMTALADARKKGCEKFVLVGDVTGYGYDVKGALALVRKNFDVVLMGNHDSVCVGLESEQEVSEISNYDIDRAQREKLSAGDFAWLKGLKHVRAMKGLAFAHGDFFEPEAWNYIFTANDAARSFFARKEQLMFCGHTHHAAVWELTKKGLVRPRSRLRLMRPATKKETLTFKIREGHRYIVNVGSVGYPRNDLCATYAIYDDEKREVALRRLPFDFKNYIADMVENGMTLPGWLVALFVAASNATQTSNKGRRNEP